MNTVQDFLKYYECSTDQIDLKLIVKALKITDSQETLLIDTNIAFSIINKISSENNENIISEKLPNTSTYHQGKKFNLKPYEYKNIENQILIDFFNMIDLEQLWNCLKNDYIKNKGGKSPSLLYKLLLWDTDFNKFFWSTTTDESKLSASTYEDIRDFLLNEDWLLYADNHEPLSHLLEKNMYYGMFFEASSLHIALLGNHYALADKLMHWGLSINKPDNHGNTPFFYINKVSDLDFMHQYDDLDVSWKNNKNELAFNSIYKKIIQSIYNSKQLFENFEEMDEKFNTLYKWHNEFVWCKAQNLFFTDDFKYFKNYIDNLSSEDLKILNNQPKSVSFAHGIKTDLFANKKQDFIKKINYLTSKPTFDIKAKNELDGVSVAAYCFSVLSDLSKPGDKNVLESFLSSLEISGFFDDQQLYDSLIEGLYQIFLYNQKVGVGQLLKHSDNTEAAYQLNDDFKELLLKKDKDKINNLFNGFYFEVSSINLLNQYKKKKDYNEDRTLSSFLFNLVNIIGYAYERSNNINVMNNVCKYINNANQIYYDFSPKKSYFLFKSHLDLLSQCVFKSKDDESLSILCLNALFDMPQSYASKINEINRMRNFFEDGEIVIIPSDIVDKNSKIDWLKERLDDDPINILYNYIYNEMDNIVKNPLYYDSFKETFKTINVNNTSKNNVSKGMKGFISWSENIMLKVNFEVDKSIKKKRHRL